jgi:hypothetical protein
MSAFCWFFRVNRGKSREKLGVLVANLLFKEILIVEKSIATKTPGHQEKKRAG